MIVATSNPALGAGTSKGPRLFFRRRAPLHPGRFLDSRFLKPLAISQDKLASALGISRRRVNELVRGRRAISADTALRLGRYFDTGPEFWLGLQQAWDNYLAWRAWHQGHVAAEPRFREDPAR
ncbi:MAG: addiction module antidote protein, HigA family [Rhodocyclaceae bacterium]|nr:MAG: addiction module antidote protein, HigA family [Rhodocyclaceae bacterium]